MTTFTRRKWIAGAAGVTLAAQTNALPKLALLPYGAVQLLDGPLQQQFEQNHRFFLDLSEDRLLKIYRQRSGLPAPGENMGGWYDDFCPGAHFGQYVSALARFSAVTRSQETRAKVMRLVNGYAQTLEGPRNFFADLRYPAYTYDKLVIMLLDAHSVLGDPQAVDMLRRTTAAARPNMPEKALTQEEKMARPHKDETYTWDEAYTLAENLFLAYERLGDREYFDMGRRYLLDKTFFDPLSRGENVLPGRHAYSHMNALSSGLQGYLKIGDSKYLEAVNHAVEMIWNEQSFATGGWGPNEGFVRPGRGELGASLTSTNRSFETPCGAYAHVKLMRYLLVLTGDARYGDSMERVIYNTVLGAKPIRPDGWSFYYSDYHDSGCKTDHRVIPGAKWPWDRDGRWPCCSGTLPQLASDYGISTYLRSDRGLLVNLYVPSRVRWNWKGIRCELTQQTDYPIGNVVNMQVTVSRPTEFSLKCRIPAWAGPGTRLRVNDKLVETSLEPGTFATITREWRSGQRVSLELDQRFASQPVDAQTPDRLAITRGPLVLFGITDSKEPIARSEFERLQITKASDDDWKFRTASDETTLRPFWRIHDERYQTYFHIARA